MAGGRDAGTVFRSAPVLRYHPCMMRNAPIPAVILSLGLLLAAPAVADPETAPGPPSDLSQGADLLERGARLMLRGLMAELEPALTDMEQALSGVPPMLRDVARMVGDMRNYHPPEKLPNGDIILRRRVPLPPEQPAPAIPKGAEIDL